MKPTPVAWMNQYGGLISPSTKKHFIEMTDKEQLELAAKAAGLQEHGWMGDTYCHVVDNTWETFDPLTDDGDALRLHVYMYQSIGTEYVELFERFLAEELYRNPSYTVAMFRRAIVRAAAEIGKGMK